MGIFGFINHKSFVFLICLIFVCSTLVLAKSRRPISETEIREKKSRCFEDIDNGLWGQQCISSMIAKENCMLQCVSPPCYELVYQGDPLEEGEKDYSRSQEYKYCMHSWLSRTDCDVVMVISGGEHRWY